MNKTVVIKFACVALVLIFVVFELFAYVLPSADALNARSFDAPIKIDEASFPDPVFRDFVSEKVDKNADGYVTPQERDAVITISASDFQGETVSDATGVELFPQLEALDLSGGSLNSLDVSKNVKLKSINLENNNETSGGSFSLDLPKGAENVITIYVSANSSITGNSDGVNIVKVE